MCCNKYLEAFSIRELVVVSDTNSGNTDSTGGGGAHNNIQPSIVAYVWERTA
jgi:hypothetical protein